MVRISHENLLPFVGICYTDGNVRSVWIYTSKGSLLDVFEMQAHIAWDWTMKRLLCVYI